MLHRIDTLARKFSDCDDARLQDRAIELRHLASQAEHLDRLLPETFALVQTIAERRIGLRHYAVQMLGGIAMHRGRIVEMDTGEGKTLTATLPATLHALTGQGVHIATANDYLARRDAEWMEPVYAGLGLTVGYVQKGMLAVERKEAYARDITYGTAREFGFDFLRDRLARASKSTSSSQETRPLPGLAAAESSSVNVHRMACCALVDEADSVLIDQAQTPLILSQVANGQCGHAPEWFTWCGEIATQLVDDVDYIRGRDPNDIRLTDEGRGHVRDISPPEVLAPYRITDLFDAVERALIVHHNYHADREYVVRHGSVVVVDEFTGRRGEGRQWRDGIHQAIEAKEGLTITVETTAAAQITLQQYFSLYATLAGMTGTAREARREFQTIYKRRVKRIAPNEPNRRIRFPDTVTMTADQKWDAIVNEVNELQATGRPVLIGTRTVEQSEILSRRLEAAEIEHRVLNAKQDAEEAQIIAEAGQSGRVTVATNMAGRGTDIQLDPDVVKAGGLHVICTEFHESHRIDRQLQGRCARQGQPGSIHQFVSLEDSLLTLAWGEEKAASWQRRLQRKSLSPSHAIRLFQKAQRTVERRRFHARRLLVRRADRQAEQRKQMGLDTFLGYA